MANKGSPKIAPGCGGGRLRHESFPHPRAPDHAIPGMALSYSLELRPSDPPASRRVLVTGAAGRIGSYYARHAPGHHEKRLLVRSLDKRARELAPFGEVVASELDDLPSLEKACAGIDTVLHLAGNPQPSAGWDDLLESNIKGTYNILAAAKSAGCRRVILASSIHAVSGYSADVQVRTSEPVNPGDLYGVSKCFMEALGRYYAEKEGLSVIALRIGAFQPVEAARKEDSFWMMDCFVSHRDLNDLIVKCIDDERLKFAIFHGVSDNRFKRLDISDARELLGFFPQDDFTRENPILRPLQLDQSVLAQNVEDPGQQSGLENS
jgi:NAD(P)-dependent dehydrogenase (short-subunit alcohol dehydrogenase family)